VVVCDSRKRIIECRDGLQWIVQTLLRGRWVGSSYCRSRVGLIEVASRHGFSPASLAELGLLPDWIEEKPGEGAR
jgi:hypothetical protein